MSAYCLHLVAFSRRTSSHGMHTAQNVNAFERDRSFDDCLRTIIHILFLGTSTMTLTFYLPKLMFTHIQPSTSTNCHTIFSWPTSFIILPSFCVLPLSVAILTNCYLRFYLVFVSGFTWDSLYILSNFRLFISLLFKTNLNCGL